MSHASTASITLGGSAGHQGTMIQPYGAPSTPQEQAQQNRARRRQRQNVPDHMRHTAPAAPEPTGGGTVNIAAPPARHERVIKNVAPPKESQMGTVYKANPQAPLQSSTPDQAFQAQTLFRPQAPAQPLAPATSVPVPVLGEISDSYMRRMEEARQKLIQLNLPTGTMEQYRRRFNVLDLNKDGVVNLREFAAISRVLGYKFSKDEILEIFGRTDLDESGDISFEEFAIAMYHRSQKTKELAPYREKFRLYDWKGRGYITSEEAYPILKKELGFDENKTEMMIDMYDRNKDYRLSLLEFIDFYKKVEELKIQVQNAFRDFDRNGDGFVDANEAKAVLRPKGFTDHQVEALIFKYDSDADGKLNLKEFTSFWDVQLV